MKYLHNYDTDAHFSEDYNGSAYTEPWVSYIQENGEVNYNKDENWIRISYADGDHYGSGYFVRIDEVGEDFDNTSASTFKLYDAGTETNTEYRGHDLYWGEYDCFLYIDDMPCNFYHVEDNDGWRLVAGFDPRCSV